MRTRVTHRPARVLQGFGVLVALALLTGCGGSRVDHAVLADAFARVYLAGPAPAGGPVGAAGAVTAPGAPGTTGDSGAEQIAVSAGQVGTTGAAGTAGAAGTPATHGPVAGPGVKSGGAVARSCTGTEQPIGLGSVGEQTGVAGAAEAAGPRTVAAWAGWVNANGGLACHHLEYHIGDAGGDPARNAALTQEFVEKEHVVAFVQQNGGLSGAGGVDYLVRHSIPVIGGDAGDNNFYEHPTWFPQVASGDTSVLAATGAIAGGLNPTQKAHVGLVTCQEAASCANFAKNGAAAASRFGIKVVFQTTASITSGDYTSICLNAQKAGAQVLGLAMDGNSISRFARSCHGVNYHPVFATGEQAVTPEMSRDANLEGMVIATVAHPWNDNANASIAQMNRVLNQYAPGATNVGEAHFGWASAMALQAASKYFPAKDTISGADIVAAMDKIKNDDLGQLTGPLTFTAGKSAPKVACYWSMAIRRGQFIGTNGNRRSCA